MGVRASDAELARAVTGTLGPMGMNMIIDRALGSPLISRDGVTIAHEIDLECPFENMRVQIVRDVSRQTNEVAGDGTTSATALAAAMVEGGLARLEADSNAIDLIRSLDTAVAATIAALRAASCPVSGPDDILAVAIIAANDRATGRLVAEALQRVGVDGIVNVEFSPTVETRLEIVEGVAFNRGYLSHHMVTDVDRMQVVLDNALILLTDQRLTTLEDVATLEALIQPSGRPLLIVAEEVAPAVIAALMRRRIQGLPSIAAIHPPDYGHWRKAMLEDLAIATGGRVIARDLGGEIRDAELADLGQARLVRIGADTTTITAGAGRPEEVAARRAQITRQYEAAPPQYRTRQAAGTPVPPGNRERQVS